MAWVRLALILLALPWAAWSEADIDPWSQGWSLCASREADWELTSGHGNLSFKNDHLYAFLVSDSTAQWELTTEPIWVYRYSHMRLRFRARGLMAHEEPLLRLRMQPIGPWDTRVLDGPPSAQRTIQPATSHFQDNVIHEINMNLDDFPYPGIDQIILSVKSGKGIGILEILEFSFHSSKKIERPAFPAAKEINNSTRYRMFTLDEDSDEQGLINDVPFQIIEPDSYQITLLSQRDQLTYKVNKKCSELFLLMTTQLAGSDKAFKFYERDSISNPDQCIVTKTYADGRIEKSFPYHIANETYKIETGNLAIYQIPVNPDNVLHSISIEEMMSYGQLLIAGVTLNCGTKSVDLSIPNVQKTLPCPVIEFASSPPNLSVERNEKFAIENDHYRVEINAEKGLAIQSLRHKVGGKELLSELLPAFSISSGLEKTSSLDWIASDYHLIQRGVEFNLHPRAGDLPLRASLSIQASTSDELSWQLRIQNYGYTPQSFRLLFPDMRNIHLSENAREDVYFYPQVPAIWGTKPIRLREDYSGAFPLRFFDLYSPEQAFGLALHTRGDQLSAQRYRYEKREEGSWMGIEYGAFQSITLTSREEFLSPPTIMQFHAGDWHTPFHTYKQNVRHESDVPSSLDSTFVAYQDYPYGGTGLIQNHDLQPLIQSARKHFGGVDLINLAGWAYTPKYGFYGDYTNHSLHDLNNANVPVALSYEGYLADSRISLIEENAENWAILDEVGKIKTWPGGYELFMDPNQSGWRNYLVQSIVQSAIKAETVLLNHLGWADNHYVSYRDNKLLHPLEGEHALLQELHRELQKMHETPDILTEHVPNEQSARFIDGSLDTSLQQDYFYVLPLNLFRYALPQCKIFTNAHPGLLPRAIPVTQAKLAFFHGQGLWLKGRAKSWYSREYREFVQKAYPIWHEFKNYFTSDNAEPFIPTLQHGLYANAFRHGGSMIVMLYNSSPHTVPGTLLKIDDAQTAKNLWKMNEWKSVKKNGNLEIAGTLHPNEVECVWVELGGGE